MYWNGVCWASKWDSQHASTLASSGYKPYVPEKKERKNSKRIEIPVPEPDKKREEDKIEIENYTNLPEENEELLDVEDEIDRYST